jgi:acyl-CoA thioesterase-1
VIPLRRALVLASLLAVLAPAAPGGAAQDAEPAIVALGDSLTAGHGVADYEAYPARLEAILRREGYRYRVVNAGVSGDTTAGGLRRVDWVLRAHPDVAIVALGANDGLRGLSVAAMRENLERIVRRLQAGGARVLLAGMRVPPNYGAEYAREFAAAFPAVARQTGAALMPFLLDGVAARPALNQEDGIHPNAAGQQAVATRLWPYLKPLLTGR